MPGELGDNWSMFECSIVGGKERSKSFESACYKWRAFKISGKRIHVDGIEMT